MHPHRGGPRIMDQPVQREALRTSIKGRVRFSIPYAVSAHNAMALHALGNFRA